MPGIIAKHWNTPIARYIGSVNVVRVVILRLEVDLIDPKQDGAAGNQREAHHPRIEQHALDETVRQRADHRRRQEGEQHADHEAPRRRVGEHADDRFSTA